MAAIRPLDRMGDEQAHTNNSSDIRRIVADQNVCLEWAFQDLGVHKNVDSRPDSGAMGGFHVLVAFDTLTGLSSVVANRDVVAGH